MDDFHETMDMDPNSQMKKSPGDEFPSSSLNALSPIPVLKKTSPLKHVTPIIKKYDCQRQAKNGKSVKLKSIEKIYEEDPGTVNPTPVQDLAAGMDSLDAALRRAEKCIAGSKDQNVIQTDDILDHGMEANGDDLVEVDEDGVSSSIAVSNQPNSGSNRAAHPRTRNRVIKKRNQLQKDLEHALPLAASDEPQMSEERTHGYAASFFFKVKERYENQDSTVFPKFLEIMEEFGKSFNSVTDLYHRVINLLEANADLCEEFLLFLMPKHALLCGKFMEHLALTEMSNFVRKLELYFAKQPQHLKKIHATWARLAETPNVNLETVRSTILPLLRGNTFLVDSFLELLPSERPPESKMTDFDQVICEDLDSEHSGEEETFERMEIPPENDDPFGGENCQCCCHNMPADPAFLNRTKHCVPCGIKFISGKIFMQTEHGLRPVRIEFSGNGSTSSNIKRLNADHQKLSRPRSRRGRTTTSQASVKSEESKHSVETDDEAVFSAKTKSPRQRPKIPKPNREKPSSARSLALNRAACPRKTAVSSGSSPPFSVIHDQEAVPAPSPSSDEKPTIDFSSISNILQSEQSEDYKEDGTMINASVCEKLAGSTFAPEGHVLEDEIKEEFRIEDGTGLETENTESKNSNIEECENDDVKDEDDACDVIQMDGTDRNGEECTDDDTESNMDVSGASSDCDIEDGSDNNEADENKEGPTWTREEDRIILCTFQSEPDREKTLHKISVQLPHRTIDQINSRFQVLMNLIKQLR